MKIYTKTGDGGETGTFGGPRVHKDNPRIEAMGEVDELNAVLGVVRCEGLDERLDALLQTVQNELFDLGAELGSPQPDRVGTRRITSTLITRLEAAVDEYDAELPPLTAFILPGGVRAAALLHLARTVCRRAERRVVALRKQAEVADEVVVYLNRLSDLLFVLARAVNRSTGAGDVLWHSGGQETTNDECP
jgi:cob(I)alamin adenosyltransferase